MNILVNKEEFIKNMDGYNEELLLRLMAIMKDKELSVRQVAHSLGMNERTLDRFLRQQFKMQLVTLSKIEKWVERKEKE